MIVLKVAAITVAVFLLWSIVSLPLAILLGKFIKRGSDDG